MICLLDMDGVLTDLVAGATTRFLGKVIESPTYAIHETCQVSANYFWSSLDIEFWANLPWTEEGKEILEICEAYFGKENVCILTSPPYLYKKRNDKAFLPPKHVYGQAVDTGYAVTGKLLWLEEELPEYAKNRQIIFGNAKRFLANSGAVLVDDYDKNIFEFSKSGGYGILIPRSYNCDKGKPVIKRLKEQLRALPVL